ncbi:activated protein kinase kinase kinase 7 [Seminavis robusta]|uniref:Activated protein kinase kinase kinase 7 n=1 Tax=Seminavis robusta TaxID=568900 RepID=A0A9N8EU60_9STRA|nr:activated protein kinase kinase kinase 7 [Seminavis robusta]|eukprot:Sro1634_g287490.1 activated protein kinase kinase kinase 7 (533) ;mRNA; f:18184-19782
MTLPSVNVNFTPSLATDNKPKRKAWFRRWMKRGAATTVVPESESLELDLKDLATALTTTSDPSRSNDNKSMVLMSLEDIRLGKIWRKGSHASTGVAYHSVQGFAKTMDHPELYSVKRLSDKKEASRDKQTKVRALKLLVREATILTKLGDHPNIVSLRGLCSTLLPVHSDFFLLTNRLHSETLEDRIHQWQQQGAIRKDNSTAFYTAIYGEDRQEDKDDDTEIPNDEGIPMKANYAFQIAKAIQACHKMKIVLRDLSPANIGFRHDDPHCVQLFDLGHAQDTESTRTDLKEPLWGKRRYMAGEIWTTGQYSEKADVYSWSMILWELCMERKPYQGMSPLEHQKYACEAGERPPLACYYLPEELDSIILQSWEHDPSRRWSIDKVCKKMQHLLMQLDTYVFFEQSDEDFLFDLFLPTMGVSQGSNYNDDTISLLGDEDEDSLHEMDLLVEAVALTSTETALQDSDAHWLIPASCMLVSDDLPLGDAACFTPPQVLMPDDDDVPPTKLPSSRASSATLSSSHKMLPVKMVSSAA